MSDMVGDLHWMAAKAVEDLTKKDGEIAKRDEELAACRIAVENCEVFRARIAELEARIVWLECEAQVNAAPVSEAKAQGVVMPEPMKRGDEGGSGEYGAAMIRGYNACLREVARLNAAPAAPAAYAWIPVSERLPGDQGHDSEEVLCFLNGHCSLLDNECRQGGGWGIRLGYYDADIGTFRVFGRPESHVTHWMPLPAAPIKIEAKP